MKKTVLAGLLILGLLFALQAQAYTWYVDLDAAPGGDGLSWANAFTNVHPALHTLAAVNASEGYNGGHRIQVGGTTP